MRFKAAECIFSGVLGIPRELCLNNIPRIVILLKMRYSSLVPFGGRFHARMKICFQKGTKGALFYEQKELQRSGERRRRVFANGAGEL